MTDKPYRGNDPTDDALRRIERYAPSGASPDVAYVRGALMELRNQLATAQATIARLEKQHYDALLAKALKP